MKKFMNKINFALISLMVSTPLFAEELNAAPFCEFFHKLYSVFNILRIADVVGAACYIAGWAWEFISGGKAEMKTIKEKGTGLLVGFILLFMVCVLLSFVLSASGMRMMKCGNDLVTKW